MNRSGPARGFSLVEVLVALVVLAIGLIGVAKLFVVTIQGNASATSRLYAVNLGADLADRIRANRTAGVAYAGSPASYGCTGGALKATLCTPAQMAADDLNLWQTQLRALLPAGVVRPRRSADARAGLVRRRPGPSRTGRSRCRRSVKVGQSLVGRRRGDRNTASNRLFKDVLIVGVCGVSPRTSLSASRDEFDT